MLGDGHFELVRVMGGDDLGASLKRSVNSTTNRRAIKASFTIFSHAVDKFR
jgi:hypothetical protein